MHEVDTIILKREQPFIVVDRNIIKKCRKRGAATPEMLLTYFIMQDMSATGHWDRDLSEDKVAELSGLSIDVVSKSVSKLEEMGVFDEKD